MKKSVPVWEINLACHDEVALGPLCMFYNIYVSQLRFNVKILEKKIFFSLELLKICGII